MLPAFLDLLDEGATSVCPSSQAMRMLVTAVTGDWTKCLWFFVTRS